ncbi:MAG: 2Fe-2S iron-sulfur cluster-binding protein [Alphaproteobacteria bacterium]
MTGRLPEPFGSLIDRSKPLSFSFEGRRVEGYEGDTVASALLANGITVLSRSFKYHRPRGPLSMAGQDGNTLVQIGPEPNRLADRVPASGGLGVSGLNCWGSLDHDWLTLIGKLDRFLPVGFYYKAFYKPRALWPFWEGVIRRVAGLGKVDLNAHHGYFDKEYLFCDVLVVGGGPAGLEAALQAAESADEVILVDENAALGGSLNYARFDAAGERGSRERARLVAGVEARPNIRVMTETVCNGAYADNWFPLIRANRLHKLRAGKAVIATGSYEQPLVFRNNDLPGVMLGSAVQRLIRLYGVKPGARAVVVAANADAYGVALDLLDAGVEIACITDLRAAPLAHPLIEAVRDRNLPIIVGATVYEAEPREDGKGVRKARIAKITGEGTYAATGDSFACDLIAVSTGYAPAAPLIYQSGGKLGYDEAAAMLAIRSLPEGVIAAGSVNGAYALDAALEDGRHAGWRAAHGGTAGDGAPAPAADKGANGVTHPFPFFPHPKGKDFVDFDEDLQVKDLENAMREGYEHIELLKRFSTNGMGPSQGRTSSMPAVRLAARFLRRSIDETGTTTSRPPVTQAKIGHFAGRSFEPVRYTAMHFRHLEAGAKMMPAGLWLRPEFYGDPSRRADLIREEAKNVRDNVGLIDVSTLGGLEVRGPDAAEFMNRMYTFAYLKQPVGRSRYVLMTDQAGVITDDGVACRLHDDWFYVTATTSGVDGVYRSMLWYNAQWRLKVDVTNVTAAYAGVNLAGPNSRKVLAKLSDADLSNEAFPYMGMREATVAGIKALLLRVGFVGELGYEIHVPASRGEALWDALMEAGREYGIRPFGVEAQRLLRLEKGHIIISQDTDGLTTPSEADMTWAIAKNKPFFVGQRSIRIQDAHGLERKLVGFEIADRSQPVPKECHLVIRGNQITGRVTSIADSPTLGKIIGLAYVAPDQAAPGTAIQIRADGGRMVNASVVKLPFFDPDGARQEL